MSTKLSVIDSSALDVQDRQELTESIDAIIASHKGNRQEINRLVFESVSAMTMGENYEQELSSKKGVRRFIGGITGSNKQLQDKINSNRSMAQYAAQQTIQRLAEQNLLTFDLITAVNNKLNASMVAVEEEINEIYSKLTIFFKQCRSDLIQLENRIERLEQNMNLLNWQNSIEYQMLDGIEYTQLSDTAKIICLARDFYDITKGKWTTSELLLLKTAMKTIDIAPQASINYLSFIENIILTSDLQEKLLGQKYHFKDTTPEYLVFLWSMRVSKRLQDEEHYALIQATTLGADQNALIPLVANILSTIQKDILTESRVDLQSSVPCFDFINELLFNIQQADTHKEDESTSALLESAYTGDTKAMCSLGKNSNDKENRDEAILWYKRAADFNDANAMYQLSKLYGYSRFVQGYTEGQLWLVRAAEAGSIDAMYELANVYMDSPNYIHQSISWYTKVAVSNSGKASDAMLKLSEYYETCDEQNAFEWCEKSAEANNHVAIKRLANCYKNGLWGVSADSAKAVKLWEKIGNPNDKQSNPGSAVKSLFGNYFSKWFFGARYDCEATYHLGLAYYTGDGVVKNDNKAVELWNRVIQDSGRTEKLEPWFASTLFHLGIMYDNGWGVAKNKAKTVELWEQAAEKNNEIAMFMLGLCYYNGEGVYIDKTKSFEWFGKVSAAGYESTIEILKNTLPK